MSDEDIGHKSLWVREERGVISTLVPKGSVTFVCGRGTSNEKSGQTAQRDVNVMRQRVPTKKGTVEFTVEDERRVEIGGGWKAFHQEVVGRPGICHHLATPSVGVASEGIPGALIGIIPQDNMVSLKL